MSKHEGKNPFVHSDEKNHMLNTAGNDGWSFDEKDDDYEESEEKVVITPAVEKPKTPLEDWLAHGGSKEEFYRFQREAQAYDELGLDNPLSDGHYEALGLEVPGE